MLEKFIEHENIVMFLITSFWRRFCHKFAKNSLICKKVMKSQNLSLKKSFLFQYWMSFKLLCNLGVCHNIHCRMTLYFIFGLIKFGRLKKKLPQLFGMNFRWITNIIIIFFDFVDMMYYCILLQNLKICIYPYG